MAEPNHYTRTAAFFLMTVAIAVGPFPGSGSCQQREYNFQPPVQTPEARPSDTSQVLEIAVPKHFHGCWGGDLDTNALKIGVRQHAKLCFTNRSWSFDISRPDMDLSALGMESKLVSPPQREMTGAGENWVEWNTIGKYDLSKGAIQMKITSENHWRCELTADHQALWCRDSFTNHTTDALGQNFTKQHQAVVRMAKEGSQ